jgi:hypothetical protein
MTLTLTLTQAENQTVTKTKTQTLIETNFLLTLPDSFKLPLFSRVLI